MSFELCNTVNKCLILSHNSKSWPLFQEETFGWADGSPVDYENWNHNEPDNEQEKCVEAEASHMGWKDVPCENTWEGYICKVKKGKIYFIL